MVKFTFDAERKAAFFAFDACYQHTNGIDKSEAAVPFPPFDSSAGIVVDVGINPLARIPVAGVDWRFDEGGDCAMSGCISVVLACTRTVHNNRTLTVY